MNTRKYYSARPTLKRILGKDYPFNSALFNSRKGYYSKWYDHTFDSYQDSVKTYLRNEFFQLEKTSLNNIGVRYKRKYGQKAYDYFVETYEKWKIGIVKMSDQTMDRLLEFVPVILTTEKQYHLLKLEIIAFIESNIEKHKNDIIGINDIDKVFFEYLVSVNKFDSNNLRWFVKDIFKVEQMKDYIDFSKYVLKSKIDLSIKSVEHDIRVINNSIFNIDKIYTQVYYMIDFLGTRVRIDGKSNYVSSVGIEKPDLSDSIVSEKKFKEILLKEVLELNFLSQVSETNGIIQENDLNTLGESISKLNSQKKVYTINSKLKGRGGILGLSIEYIPRSNIILSILFHSLLIVSGIIIISIIIYLVIENVIPNNLKCFIFGGGLILIYYLGLFMLEQVMKIRIQTTYLKNHY